MITNLLPKLVVALVFLMAAVYLINTANTTGLFLSLSQQEENQRPANLEIIKISAESSCQKCFDPTPVAEGLKSNSGKVRVVKEEVVDSDSERGKQLVQEMGIRRVPTVIVKGEFEKENAKDLFSVGWKRTKTGAFFEQVPPPYINLDSKSVIGLVESIILADSSCPKCFDFNQVIQGLERSGVAFGSRKTVDYKSLDGQEFLSSFGLSKVPALLISSNAREYQQIEGLWSQIEAKEKEGFLVVSPVFPPYKELPEGKVKGLVDVVYLVDSSCKDCYDVDVNKQIFGKFGLSPATEKTVDVGSEEGSGLVAKYNITKVPIVLFSPEASEYKLLGNAWSQVGSIEEDGWFVMRSPELLGKHKDLTNSTSS